MLITDAIADYLAAKSNGARTTYTWYKFILTKFLGYCDKAGLERTERISIAHFQAFVSDNPDDSERTRHSRAQVVKGWLNWCADDESYYGVRAALVRKLEMPKVHETEVEIFTPAHIDKLLLACAETRWRYRNTAIVYLLLETGIRASECCYNTRRQEERTGLKTEDLILGKGSGSHIYIVSGKEWKARRLGIGVQTVQALRNYLQRERGRSQPVALHPLGESRRRRTAGHSECPYLFVAQGDKPLSVRTLEGIVKELGEIAGIENVYPHRFRHTFAINQLLLGTSEPVLMRLMGHESPEALRTYLRALSKMQAMKAGKSVMDDLKKRNPSLSVFYE